MSRNILLVWDRMGDYHRARWEALQAEFPDRKVYAADLGGSDTLYGWNTTASNPLYVLLSEKPPDRFDFSRIKKFIRVLSGQNIGTVCISGYGKLEYLMFILYARFTRRRVILFAESWYPSNFIVDKLKSLFLRLMSNGFLVSGSRAYFHFTKRLKISAHKTKVGYSVVDNAHFSNPTSKTRVFSKRLLCVARFAPEKNLQLLIAAFLKSNLLKQNWELHIVGGGPLKSELERLAADSKNIKLCPWKPYRELPAVYHSADIFILPSAFEPWGLVVNEAMAAGLPIILNEAVGCVPDFLENGKNGLIFQTSEASLVELFNKILAFPIEKLTEMGERSKQKIGEFSLQTFSENLKALIDIPSI